MLAERQLLGKSSESNSWFVEIKKICLKYDIHDCYGYLLNPLEKSKWKLLITKNIHSYWESRINEFEESSLYSSLYNIRESYTVGQAHPLITTVSANISDISKIPTRVKLATRTYILQENRSKFREYWESAICLPCNTGEETMSHFLIECSALESDRSLVETIRKQMNFLQHKLNLGLGGQLSF